jgi:hypothetical protein
MSTENQNCNIKVYHRKKIDDTGPNVKLEKNRLIEISQDQKHGESTGITINIRMTVNRKCTMVVSSLASLAAGGFIRFEVVNPIMFMFQERDLHHLFSTQKSVFVTCETVQRILTHNFQDVIFNADIFSRAKMFLPIFFSKYKLFILCVVDFVSQTVSFHSPTNQLVTEIRETFETIMIWLLEATALNNKKYNTNRVFNRDAWRPFDYSSYLTISESATNSGVYVMVCTDCISSNQLPPAIDTLDMETAREYFTLSLLTGSFATTESPDIITKALLNIPGPQDCISYV